MIPPSSPQPRPPPQRASPQPRSSPTPKSRPAAPDYIEAWTAAQQFVTDSLKAPSTADFGGLSEYQYPREKVTVREDGVYVVRIWVDAENSFGAKVRTHFVVKMRHGGGSRWELVEPLVPVSQ
jgi:hypothetical protein